MAFFHMHVRGIAPSRASSAVKTSAYISGRRLLDERTGEVAEYARTERVVGTGLLLPDAAPDWGRQRLWNEAMAVVAGGELAAKSYEVALPRELGRADQRVLVLEFCEAFRSRGLACEWAIHDAGDGNPHAHVLVSAHVLGKDGFVPSSEKAKKSGKVYLCRAADGSDILVPASDWKAAKAAGIEKVFNFKDGARRTLSEAAAVGLTRDDRKSKTPVAVTVTPDGARAFDAEKAALVGERARWAALVNRALAAAGSDARVDHRSLADQGVNRLPTVHEGAVVRKIEREAVARAAIAGAEYAPVTDARRRNVEVARRNGLLAALERGLADVISAIRRFKNWWVRAPDAGEARRRRFIRAHRARAMRAPAASIDIGRAGELIAMVKERTDPSRLACWGYQVAVNEKEVLRLTAIDSCSRELLSIDESVKTDLGVKIYPTYILPSDFSADSLDVLFEVQPELFDSDAAEKYPEIREAIDRREAAAYRPDPMSCVEPEPSRRTGRDRGLDR